MAANTGWRPVPALGCASLGVGGLALVALGFGEGIAFSVLGRRPLAGLGELWWRLLGWGAWPCALLLALAGVGLLASLFAGGGNTAGTGLCQLSGIGSLFGTATRRGAG